MPAKEPIVDFSEISFDRIVGGIEEIRRHNPQRFEMEQLSGILLEDLSRDICVGFKNVTDDEFWVRGHMPGYPLLPGVLMCEASAQLCSYYSMTNYNFEGQFLGFGGMNDIQFRAPVRPGDRLVLVSKETRYNRRQMVFNVQGFVNARMVFHGDIIGVLLRRPEG